MDGLYLAVFILADLIQMKCFFKLLWLYSPATYALRSTKRDDNEKVSLLR